VAGVLVASVAAVWSPIIGAPVLCGALVLGLEFLLVVELMVRTDFRSLSYVSLMSLSVIAPLWRCVRTLFSVTVRYQVGSLG
jgi:hypothetical protein